MTIGAGNSTAGAGGSAAATPIRAKPKKLSGTEGDMRKMTKDEAGNTLKVMHQACVHVM